MSATGEPLRALIYNRVSADPTGRRISTASQDAENRAFCELQGWTVVDTITDDDRSASRFATRRREGFERVQLAIAGQGYGRIDVLVTWESSRGERRLDGYVKLRDILEKHNVLLAYKGRVHDMADGDDRFTTGLDALLDEREAERARDRTERGHRTSVDRGTPRGVIPYGYMREYDPGTGHMTNQVPDPESAPVVQEIVSRLLAGETVYAIVQDLNRRGVPSPRAYRLRSLGREGTTTGWSASAVPKMLRKQSLMGIRTHKGRAMREGTWEAIVSPADWSRVQRVLSDPLRVAPRGVAPQHLLSGIALCGVCGGQLRAFNNAGRPTYRCGGKSVGAPMAHVSRARDPLDRFVTRPLLARLQRPDVLALLAGPADPESDVQAAVDELRDLQARLDAFAESAAEGGISPAMLAGIERRLRGQIEEARARAVPQSVAPEVLAIAGPDADSTWQRWGGEPDGLRRQRVVLRALLRVTIYPVKARGARGFEAETVTLSWRSGDAAEGDGPGVQNP